MNEDKNEEPTVFEAINEAITIGESEVPAIKVKKPRSEKQKMALQAMLKKRQEMAIVQRAERKERRAPKWYREINEQDKQIQQQNTEIQDMKTIIDLLKEQMISSADRNEATEDEEEPIEEPKVVGLKNGVYYRPVRVIRQEPIREITPVERFSQNDRLSLLHRIL